MKTTLNFEYEKSTKNTHRYKEVPEEGKPPRVGSLYVQKWAYPDQPATLTVTIE